MLRTRLLPLLLAPACALAPPALGAQAALPEAVQIAAATAPLPEAFRAGATVRGYRGGDPALVTLREGEGEFVCLASDPRAERFHAACYHASLEPFMERGRELRAAGVRGATVDSVRNAEVLEGRVQMPAHAALYSLTGPPSVLDPATGAVRGARPLYVLYLPLATGASTGLSERPVSGAPWLMDAGTTRAHVMFVPEMGGH